jgi:hypothetical protein
MLKNLSAICSASNPCQNNGVCMLVEANSSQTAFICSCMPGYEGEFCERVKFFIGCPPINPCLNDGICVEKLHGFKCSCMANFHGSRCQHKNKTTNKNLNSITTTWRPRTTRCTEFASKCLNHGICVDTIFGAKCQCLHQYTGFHCESSRFQMVLWPNGRLFLLKHFGF